MKKNVVISWSSGKDSTLTLLRLLENPKYQVVALYTTHVNNDVPFQATPLDVVQMQADLIGLPLITIELPCVFPSNDIYQSTVINGLKESKLSIEAVAFGDMFCNGIAEYRRSYIEPQGWQCVFPLMGDSSQLLAQEIIQRNIVTSLITIDGERLSRDFCGRIYNETFLEDLPQSIDPCGENGEFHTLVTEAPCFSGRIELELQHIDHDERFSYQRYNAIALPNRKEQV
ncbi:hypothetical protein A1QO_05045 [Vibrio genomosp. F10 str. ZF-129]|uniref:Diphthamide synthase domain-containing protein n=1 Tax=Vibrio genomosp. F10 str. ZF-129 TaxID=1187848 RepID=A0A1E5BH88_9VIBR|nr:hypothetical protein [Vibrio genomosp. F10]OEE36236.1 hypothetical protein A1QO_05045 [Vibrio genomosp. F10 str. ZF-129]